MILKASQRGGASALASHLLNVEDNEHVELHHIEGFVASDLRGAFKETQALALGTRCTQPFFHVSMSPPENARVAVDVFERAASKIIERMGLEGQPRALVFHEKEGRRHAHLVVGRINAETMTAKPLSHFKLKLTDLSRELYLEHGWSLPKGLQRDAERRVESLTLAEWQQAKRQTRDPTFLREMVRDCWAKSDSADAFRNALEARGLFFARGDRRGHVVVTMEGEVHALARLAGLHASKIRARLGEPVGLPSVDATRASIAERVSPRLRSLVDQAQRLRREALTPLVRDRQNMRVSHKAARNDLDDRIATRHALETRERSSRLRRGVAGLWDRLTGAYQRTRAINEREAGECQKRDRAERFGLVSAQLGERRGLQDRFRRTREHHGNVLRGLYSDLDRQRSNAPKRSDAFNEAAHGRSHRISDGTEKSQPAPRGPSLGR